MNKQEIVAQLNKHLAEAAELRKQNHATAEFPRWRDKVLRTLQDIYGRESSQYSRFENAPGKSFKVNTELGMQQDYVFKLDCYESSLKTLIQRAEMS